MQRLAVISDTHWGGWDEARPECQQLKSALRGYQGIWHAGDVVDESVLLALEELAPVVCVKGNCDGFIGRQLPHAVRRQVEGVNLAMIHGWDLPLDHARSVTTRFPLDTAVIIHGHTHVQRYERVELEGGPCYLINPGSVSQPRQGDTRGFGELVINGSAWSYRRLELPPENAQGR